MAEPLRRRVRAGVLRGMTRVAGYVPEPAIRGVLGLAGAAAARSRFGRMTRANLALALGNETTEAERERIASGVFRHSARLVSEWLRLARSTAPDAPDAHRGAWIERAVRFDESIGILERELARGRGAIVVTAHVGNWELLAAALRRRGFHGDVVGLERPHDSSSSWLVAMRRAYGVGTISQSSSPRTLLRVLQAGRILGLLPDLEVRRLDGEFVPFFGRPALTMTAPAAIARAHRAPLIPIRCIAVPTSAESDVDATGPGGDYILRVEEPLALDPSLDRRAATRDATERMNALFEAWIRETPEQWAWHQPRWRTTPGEYETVPLVERTRRTRARRAAGGSASE